MGVLDNLERGLERFVNGAFAKTFKSGLQPVEITSAIRREMDTKAAVVSRDRVLAPNRFTVYLASADLERMKAIGPSLDTELAELARKHADQQGYQFTGTVVVTLARDAALTEGTLRVESSSEQSQASVTWKAVLEVAGRRVDLRHGRLVIGRGTEADVTIDDGGASRKHAAVEWDGTNARVIDLGSTNGTQLNGLPVTDAVLGPDSTITIGRTNLVYRVVAVTSGSGASGAGSSGSGSTYGGAGGTSGTTGTGNSGPITNDGFWS